MTVPKMNSPEPGLVYEAGFGRPPKAKRAIFPRKEAQEMTPKVLTLAKVCSVLGNIRDVSWHLSKRGSELKKRRTFTIWTK